MTTKAAFIAALGTKLQAGTPKEFTRTTGNVLTSTAHGLQTGAGPYKVINPNSDAPSGIVAAVRASTFVTGASVIATDVLNVAGKAYTVIATPADDGDVDLGASDPVTMGNFAAAINLGPGAGTAYDVDTVGNPTVRAHANGAVLTIEALTLDATTGNAIAVTSPDATLTVDNATLQGGVDGTDYYIIALTDDTFSLATSRANAIAGTAVTLADAGTGINQLVATSETLAEAMEDVVTNRLTHPGIRVRNAAENIAEFWQTLIDGVAN